MSSQKSSFVPPSFGKFGKNTKDLFKKKYDFEHSLKTVNRSSTGLVLESGAVLTDASTLRGYVKANLPTSQGEFATELYTDAAQDSRANYRFTKLAKGVSANVVFSTKDKDRAFKNSVGALELEYSQDNLATTLTAKSDANVTKLDASATVGTDGLSVGAQAVVDASAGFAVNDYNFGAEYAQNDYTVSLFTEKSASFVTASYFQRVSPAQSLGASFRYEVAGKNDRSLTVGSEYRVDADTTVKSKLELPTGDLSTHIEHRLANPRALVGIASTFNVNSTKLQAQKFGFSVSLGDF